MPTCLFWWDYDKDKKQNTTLLPMNFPLSFIAFKTINQNKEFEETEEHACTFDWFKFDHVNVVYQQTHTTYMCSYYINRENCHELQQSLTCLQLSVTRIPVDPP